MVKHKWGRLSANTWALGCGMGDGADWILARARGVDDVNK